MPPGAISHSGFLYSPPMKLRPVSFRWRVNYCLTYLKVCCYSRPPCVKGAVSEADWGIDNPSAPAGHLPLHRGGMRLAKIYPAKFQVILPTKRYREKVMGVDTRKGSCEIVSGDSPQKRHATNCSMSFFIQIRPKGQTSRCVSNTSLFRPYTSLAPAGTLSSSITSCSFSPRSADNSIPQLS